MGMTQLSLYGICVFTLFSRHIINSNPPQLVFLFTQNEDLRCRDFIVESSSSESYFQSLLFEIETSGKSREARPCGHPFRLHAEGNRFIIRNDFPRDEAIDVGKVIIVGCRYLSNTGYHLVRS